MSAPEVDVNLARLESFLSEVLEAPVVETEVLNAGLNLNVAVSTDEEGGAGYVLRRPNRLRETSYIIDLEREYGVLERLRGTAIPAPDPVLFCEDESVVGDRFFVVTRLDGEPVPLGSDLPERFRHESARERFGHRLVDTLASIHSLDVEPFEGVCERNSPRDQIARCVAHLDESARVTGRDLSALRSVADWLEANAPSDAETGLVHGDFRPGNVLFAGETQPEIAGVLDWETAMLGDPRTELGYLLLRWRDDGDPTPSLADLEARYDDDEALRDLRETNENGLAPFTNDPGSPTRRELVARYEAQTGIEFEDERFYRALGAFMLATVWEDLHRTRVEAGEPSDWEPYADYVTMLAESIVGGEFGL